MSDDGLPQGVIDELAGRLKQIGTHMLKTDDGVTDLIFEWLARNPVKALAFRVLWERAYQAQLEAVTGWSALLIFLGAKTQEQDPSTPFLKKLMDDGGTGG